MQFLKSVFRTKIMPEPSSQEKSIMGDDATAEILALQIQMSKEELPGKMLADLLIVAHRHEAEDLLKIALDKIRTDRKIIGDDGFRKAMKGADPAIMMNVVKDL